SARRAVWKMGPSSQSRPSQRRSSIACSAAPGFTRGESMSSMRRRTLPPAQRAASQAIRYVRALPTCCAPVGEGARRPTAAACGFAPVSLATTFLNELERRIQRRVVFLREAHDDRHVVAVFHLAQFRVALAALEFLAKRPSEHVERREVLVGVDDQERRAVG